MRDLSRWQRRRRITGALVLAVLQGCIDTLVNYRLWLPIVAVRIAVTPHTPLRLSSRLLRRVVDLLAGVSLSGVRQRPQRGTGPRTGAAEQAATQAQLVMLTYQLNPHFLFNALNAITSLVVTHRNAGAEAMLGRLFEFPRDADRRAGRVHAAEC